MKTKLSISKIEKACELMTKPNWSYLSILNDLEIDSIPGSSEYQTIYDIYTNNAYSFISKKYVFVKPTDTRSKYSDDVVHQICKLLKTNITQLQISNIVGCKESFVGDIKTKRGRKEISDQYF